MFCCISDKFAPYKIIYILSKTNFCYPQVLNNKNYKTSIFEYNLHAELTWYLFLNKFSHMFSEDISNDRKFPILISLEKKEHLSVENCPTGPQTHCFQWNWNNLLSYQKTLPKVKSDEVPGRTFDQPRHTNYLILVV